MSREPGASHLYGLLIAEENQYRIRRQNMAASSTSTRTGDIELTPRATRDQLAVAFLNAVHRADRDGQATRVASNDRVLAVIKPPSRHGPDMLEATASAGSLPEMRAIAMAKARLLYGEDAELRVESAGRVRTYGSGFMCTFTIRCLNFPGEAL